MMGPLVGGLGGDHDGRLQAVSTAVAVYDSLQDGHHDLHLGTPTAGAIISKRR